MSLNDIRLTPQLLADLFGTTLIETDQKTTAQTGVKALGGNAKNILIVVKNDSKDILPGAEQAFLLSILTACKLGLEDVALINWQTIDELGYKDLLHQFESRFVLLFDVTPVQFGLPMDFPHFQIQAFDSRQYLFAPALHAIQEHKGTKGELWTALKKLFLL